jgi:Flp pilus assembly protein TadG
MKRRVNPMVANAICRLKSRNRRKGATVVEFAVIAPVVFLLLIGFAVLTMGVFRYQQVAYLARQGARYASTHGAQYHVDCRLPPGDQATWSAEIREAGILPWIAALDSDQLTSTVAWSAGDNRANAANAATGFETTIDNRVTVTVTYTWFPEALLAGPFELESVATMPVHY